MRDAVKTIALGTTFLALFLVVIAGTVAGITLLLSKESTIANVIGISLIVLPVLAALGYPVGCLIRDSEWYLRRESRKAQAKIDAKFDLDKQAKIKAREYI